MSWEKTHEPGGVGCKPWDINAIFAQVGAIWKCDECGTRWKVINAGQGQKGWKKA